MIIFLYGPDSYRRQQRQQELVEKYKARHSALTIDRFDLDEEGAGERLKEFLGARSLFGEKKMVVVTNLFLLSEANSSNANLRIPANDGNTILLLIAEKEPPEDWQWLLEKPVISEEFKNLEGAAWKKFVNQQVASRGLTLNSQTINSLATAYQGDSWGLVTELDKLALLVDLRIACPVTLKKSYGACPVNLERSNEANHYQYTNKHNFIELIKTISWRGGLSTKIPALEILLNNEDHGRIFNILAAFTSGPAKTKMADYDIAVKSGKLDYETALLDFVLER